jgi:hypothetical protein
MSFITILILVAVVMIGFRLLMGKAIKTNAATLQVGTVQTFTYTGKSGALSEQFSKMGMERHINLMIANGWEVVNQTGLPGHVRLGRTLTGAALTGGLSLLAGGSRTADRVTITYRRVQVPPRPAHGSVKSCAACRGNCTSNSLFCAFCGNQFLDGTVPPSPESRNELNKSPLPAGVKVCPSCEGRCTLNSKFCAFCGHSFAEVVVASKGSNIDDLERLAALRERGVLSDAEFENAKSRLLGSSSG